jgi:hypothetical protein
MHDDRISDAGVRCGRQVSLLNEEVLILGDIIDSIVIRMMKQVQGLVLTLSLMMMVVQALRSSEMTLGVVCHSAKE